MDDLVNQFNWKRNNNTVFVSRGVCVCVCVLSFLYFFLNFGGKAAGIAGEDDHKGNDPMHSFPLKKIWYQERNNQHTHTQTMCTQNIF